VGELLAGTPPLRLGGVVSLPLNLISVLSLLYRAERVEGLDPWLAAARRTLPPELRRDLDLLHGFSGPLLYYVEEPVMRFEPLRPDRRGADFADLLAFFAELPAAAYRQMAAHALERVHRDQGREFPFLGRDAAGWRLALQRGVTTARVDDALALIDDPPALKARTIALYRGVWESLYRDEYAAQLPELRQAAASADAVADRGFRRAFEELTDHRPPPALVDRLSEVREVAFSPSPHLGGFVSYIVYPPNLIVYFDGSAFLRRRAERAPAGAHPPPAAVDRPLPDEALVDALRAVADPTRLRIIDLLGAGELYAQEIVGRLGLAQSAVSRHLAQLERAGLVLVEARRGSKYYRVATARLDQIADALRRRGRTQPPAAAPAPTRPEAADDESSRM